MRSDGRSSLSSVTGTIIGEVHPLPLRRNFAPEALKIAIPEDDIALTRLVRLDLTLRQFHVGHQLPLYRRSSE